MSDVNDRIAKAKGWEWRPKAQMYVSPNGSLYADAAPNYVGTLEGVAGMLRELNEGEEAPVYWTWGYCPLEETVPMSPCYIVTQHCGDVYCTVQAHSDPTHPGDCVGEAYLSMKEANDAEPTD